PRYRSTRQPATISRRALPSVLCLAISRIVSTDSCLAVSIKLHVFTTRISASSGRVVNCAPARSSKPIITSESTRFLGQPSDTNPTTGEDFCASLLTSRLYRGAALAANTDGLAKPGAEAVLTVFSVEHVANHAPAFGVNFAFVAAFGFVLVILGIGLPALGFAAPWTAVDKARFVGPQLKIFSAYNARF